MLDSVKAIQAQQIYRVQPISLNEKSNYKNNEQQRSVGVNFFTGKTYYPNYPSVEGSPVLGKSLDLLG